MNGSKMIGDKSRSSAEHANQTWIARKQIALTPAGLDMTLSDMTAGRTASGTRMSDFETIRRQSGAGVQRNFQAGG